MLTDEMWNQRYEAGNIPWDMNRPNPILEERLAADPSLGTGDTGEALVPGCGRGWDAIALARAGWKVVALDTAPAAVAYARDLLAPYGGDALVADALGWEGTADLVFDHTFFCALPLEGRPGFGELARRVTEPGGRVASIVFPIGKEPASEGPPFAMSPEDVSAVLGPRFEIDEIGPETTVGRRSWPHRWAGWRRINS